MKCPFCGHPDTQVKDSRSGEDGGAIRRRRLCPQCNGRFTTYERVQLREIIVIKRTGERRPFEREKIARSMYMALRKRPVDDAIIEQTISQIVHQLELTNDEHITSETIGTLVMDTLKKLDSVAYIRYASVYRDFREAEDFGRFVEDMTPPLS